MKDFTIDGYVTKNVEVRSTGSGQLVTRFSVNSPNYNRETRQSAPQFFECEYWHSGPQDDKAANIVEGALLLLWGQLAFDQWQDRQTGQNRSKSYLKVREVGVIRPPQPRQYQQGAYAQQAGYPPQAACAPQQAYAQQRGYARGQAPAGAQRVAQAPAPARPPYAPQPQPAPEPPQGQQPTTDLYDEDIPF